MGYQRRVHGESQVSSLWLRMRLLLILPHLAVAIAQKRSYDGHQVLRVGPLDDESYFVLRDLQMTSNALDFWTEPAPGRTTDINIPPEGLASVKAWLEEKGISYSIMIEDLGPLSESNQPKNSWTLYQRREASMQWTGRTTTTTTPSTTSSPPWPTPTSGPASSPSARATRAGR